MATLGTGALLAAGQQRPADWMLGCVRPPGRALALTLLLSVVGIALNVVQPHLTKLLIDDGLSPVPGARSALAGA